MLLILKFARSYPTQSLIMLLCLIMAGVIEGIGLTALLPLMKKAIDLPLGSAAKPAISSGSDKVINTVLSFFGIPSTIGWLLAIILVGAILSSLLMLLADRKIGYTVAHVATDLRLALLRALLSTRWGYLLGQQVGSMANAAGTEVMRSASGYLHAATAMAMIIQVFAYFIIALLVSWKTTLIFMSLASLILLMLNTMVAKSRRAGRKQTRLLKSLLARLSDSMNSLKAYKAMGRENLAEELLSTNTMQLQKALRRQVFSKAALRGVQDPVLTLLVITGLYVMLIYLKMDLPKVLMLMFLMNRMMKETAKVQRKFQDLAICESAYWSLQEKITTAQKYK